MEVGRVIHSWCMWVVSHGYGGMEVVMVCMQDKARGWLHVRRCRSTSRVQGDTLMTPDHTAVQVRSSGKGHDGIGRSSWKGLNTGRRERLRFVVHAASWLHSMDTAVVVAIVVAVIQALRSILSS